MKKLVIAEKPSVGRDIARVLGCKQQGKQRLSLRQMPVVRENWLRDGFWRRQGTRNR